MTMATSKDREAEKYQAKFFFFSILENQYLPKCQDSIFIKEEGEGRVHIE